MEELLGKKCKVGKLLNFLNDIGIFEDIWKFNGEEIGKRNG